MVTLTRWYAVAALGALWSGACASPGPLHPPERAGQVLRDVSLSSQAPSRLTRDPTSLIAAPSALSWAGHTASPRWETVDPARLPGCVAHERPLTLVARAIAEARARGATTTDMKDVVVLLRSLGSPHVWPRVWSLESPGLSDDQVRAEWSSWVSRAASRGQRRCGVARLELEDGRGIAVGVVVDALADLAPLPLRARVGQWLSLEARLLAASRSGQLLLLGPDEVPRRVPSRLDGEAFHATFSFDQQGFWRLQLVLDVGAGPQPALEAWVFVDVEPELDAALPSPAPGVAEPPAGASVEQLRAALSSRIAGVRRARGVPALARDERLDALAQAHVEAMLRGGRTAHDVGDGLPLARALRAGLSVRRVGENVARARTLERAHRVLWGSPSHRRNLLDAGYDAVGIGVVRTDASDVVVCELFVDYGEVIMQRALPPAGAHGLSPGDASRSPRRDLVREP